MTLSMSGTLLDGCVLAVLASGDAYGYKLTQSLQQAAQLSESTLYPVLRRLQKDGCLETYDSPYAGRNRRYYKITPAGTEKLSRIRASWEQHKELIDGLFAAKQQEEGDSDE